MPALVRNLLIFVAVCFCATQVQGTCEWLGQPAGSELTQLTADSRVAGPESVDPASIEMAELGKADDPLHENPSGEEESFDQDIEEEMLVPGSQLGLHLTHGKTLRLRTPPLSPRSGARPQLERPPKTLPRIV